MNKNHFPIDPPEEDVIAAQIRQIVDTALAPNESFPVFLWRMYKQLGFRHLFRDWTEILFTLLLFISLGILTALAAADQPSFAAERAYAFIFMLSPLVYLALSLLFFVRRMQDPIHEVEMSCTYSGQQIASLRMLVFGAAALLINSGVLIFLRLRLDTGTFNLPLALTLSAASLLLFASLFLYVLLRVRSNMMRIVLGSSYAALCILLLGPNESGSFFSPDSIPFYLYLPLGALFAFFFLKNLRRLADLQRQGGHFSC
ncbi:hypothetical protein [Saccharibacillus kuerlensis]|uniref:Uncharacterized protein n=1 Tax=Saccharibacillus kuerlensis TaxID=459527 RepID=A0ABQ2KSM5_9BACL|nr:hypothetical protein [Saccharibacillus kuerlensis]GGN91859.1 hypothetical protein GCM10010969_03760 [Saccharibacillus kuerlensis]